MVEKETIHSVLVETAGNRLDKALALLIPDLSRSRLQALIDAGNVSLADGKIVTDASRKVKAGEIFKIAIPPPEEALPKAQNIDISILYEDKYMLVINKPAGLVVHPAVGNRDGTLVNALLAHCGGQLSGIGGVKRPGIVHRLDKETSGLMVVAKSDAAHKGLSEQLVDRTLSRVYQAVVWGALVPRQGRIEGNIGRSKTNRKKMAVVSGGGKPAATNYKTLESFGMLASLAECKLETGRTHQIRVHMAHRQHWLVGDPVYGRSAAAKALKPFINAKNKSAADYILSFPRQALHAWKIGFIHPVTGVDMEIESDIPADMQELLRCFAQMVKIK